MKLHTDWLLRYLDRPIAPRELVDAMPRAGLEVEAEAAEGDGYAIELKVLPNRPDCLGILGVARELAALFDAKLVVPPADLVEAGGAAGMSVVIEDATLCRRFTVARFSGVTVAPSPPWLQAVLLSAGMRPINNVVDITNFVMWETGQPLHAFDAAKVTGGITVRTLRPDESVQLLSGKTIDTKYGHPLCVCDDRGPLALAGIMGGRASETTTATQEVLLEIAYFDPVHVRGNVKTLRRIDGTGGTDASYRFERGVDPNAMLDYARRRAYSLIAELAGGRLAAPPTDVYPTPVEPRVFDLSADRVSRLLGIDVSAVVIQDSLRKLGYDVSDGLRVTVPTFRVDVNDPVVLTEDVARMIGYDNIVADAAPTRPTLGRTSHADRLRQSATRALVDSGWLETKNDPLEAENRTPWLGLPADAIVLTNAATTEMNTLRRTLIGGLVASAQRNVFRGATGLRLFEIDRTFADLPGRWTLGGVCGGDNTRTAWRGQRPMDFFDLKGELEDLFENLGIREASFAALDRAPGLEGATAAIELGDVAIGWAGELDPKQARIERMAFKAFAFEIDLAALEASFGRPVTAAALSKQPASQRDLAIVLAVTVPFDRLDRAVRQSGGEALRGVALVDEYKGAQVPAGHRSLALRLTFRDDTRTLTADEISAAVERIVGRLTADFGATLRA